MDSPGNTFRCAVTVRRMVSVRRLAGRLYARCAGYFWLPCPSCGEYFGGHERARSGHLDSVPHMYVSNRPAGGVAICPRCTRQGVGCRAHAKRGMYHGDCMIVTVPPLGWPSC